MTPTVAAFFDEATYTVSYVVIDDATNNCAIVDPVLNYEPASGRTSTTAADEVIQFVRNRELEPLWILETHVHADHLSAAPYLRDQIGGQIAIGKNVTAVQTVFGKIFNVEPEFLRDGSQFDRLIADGEVIAIGELQGKALHTPGHTPACMTYVLGDTAFVGDTLFMPDYGTSRTDFPGGDATTLYRSIQRIFSLPEKTRLFMCHDYKAPGRDEYRWETTVAEQRSQNVHIRDGTTEADFVRFRTQRDATLNMPKLLLPAVQVNMRAGRLPPPEGNGTCYLKIPVNAL